MTCLKFRVLLLLVLPLLVYGAQPLIVTTDELENHISAEDIRELMNLEKRNNTSVTSGEIGYAESYAPVAPDHEKRNYSVDCFGIGALGWLFDMQPDPSNKINTHFYFSSRLKPERGQVFPGEQFGLEWVDFKPERQTVVIVHGFMSHSQASWVTDMAAAFLKRGDYNVIAVDWSAGSSTFKYWKAVANTRRVGTDIMKFLIQLRMATGARYKDFHFVGHSLGAHIASYASSHLGGVGRITGLDPAQPCFSTTDRSELLDETDADFVDVIHTNGRLLQRIGLGVPHPIGHADFYPNGGMRQPGCHDNKTAWYNPARVLQAICSHGRAYLLFTESLLTKNCSFISHRWNLSYEGVNSSLVAACERRSDCAEMGINAIGGKGHTRASGPYFVLTTNQPPFCPTEIQRRYPGPDLLWDLLNGFRLTHFWDKHTTTEAAYADPLLEDRELTETTTTQKSWFKRWFG